MSEIIVNVPSGMKSWKTTLAGAITALGAYLISLNGWENIVGQVLVIAGPVLLGLFSKDANVTGGTVAQATPPAVEAAKTEMK